MPACALLLLSACAGLPGQPAAGKQPGEPSPVARRAEPADLPMAGQAERNPAVRALLVEAQQHRAAGDPARSAVSLERALRIDARDPDLWLELARVHVDLGDWSAAGQFARKARRLAGVDEALAREAEAIIRTAAAEAT